MGKPQIKKFFTSLSRLAAPATGRRAANENLLRLLQVRASTLHEECFLHTVSGGRTAGLGSRPEVEKALHLAIGISERVRSRAVRRPLLRGALPSAFWLATGGSKGSARTAQKSQPSSELQKAVLRWHHRQRPKDSPWLGPGTSECVLK